jgi:hypothetical protein
MTVITVSPALEASFGGNDSYEKRTVAENRVKEYITSERRGYRERIHIVSF